MAAHAIRKHRTVLVLCMLCVVLGIASHLSNKSILQSDSLNSKEFVDRPIHIGIVADDSTIDNGAGDSSASSVTSLLSEITSKQKEQAANILNAMPGKRPEISLAQENLEQSNVTDHFHAELSKPIWRRNVILSDSASCEYMTWGHSWREVCGGKAGSKLIDRHQYDLRLTGICLSDNGVKPTFKKSEPRVMAYVVPGPHWERLFTSNNTFVTPSKNSVHGEISVLVPNASFLDVQYIVKRVLMWTMNEESGHKDMWLPNVMNDSSQSILRARITKVLREAIQSITPDTSVVPEYQVAFTGFTLTFAFDQATSNFVVTATETLRNSIWICRHTESKLRDDALTMLYSTLRGNLDQQHFTHLQLLPHRTSGSFESIGDQLVFVPLHANLAIVSQEYAKNLNVIDRTYSFLVRNVHFQGGQNQYKNHLLSRGWKNGQAGPVAKSGNYRSKQLLRRSTIVLDRCRGNAGLREIKQRAYRSNPNTPALLSYDAEVAKLSNKQRCFQSIQRYFGSMDCDYRKYYPETVLASKQSECPAAINFFEQEVKKKTEEGRKSSLFFAKSHLESFGRGVEILSDSQILKGLKAGCPQRPAFRAYLLQRGVQDILLYNNHVTQARHYVVISSVKPWTAFYLDGYYNVAPEPIHHTSNENTKNVRESLLTNTRTNNENRLTQYDLEEYLIATKAATNEMLVSLRRETKSLAMAVAEMYFDAHKEQDQLSAPSFHIYGIDVILDKQLRPYLLETNCNCELFWNPAKHGDTRVELSRKLVGSTIDAAIALGLVRDPKLFAEIVQHWTSTKQQRTYTNEVRAKPIRADPADSVENQELELLFTDATSPPWKYRQWVQGKC